MGAHLLGKLRLHIGGYGLPALALHTEQERPLV